MKRFSLHAAIFALAAVSLFAPVNGFCQAVSAKAEAAKLKKAGVIIVPCPKFIAKLSTGLYTSLNPADVLCSRGASGKKAGQALKKYSKGTFNLDGKLKGSGFLDVIGQQGDVNTDPFQEINYPVAIFFDMTNADYDATYRFNIIDADTDKSVDEVLKGHVPAAGWVDWVGSGRFYFKTNALPDKNGDQPVFNVNMQFMDQYEGFPASKSDLSDS